MRDFGERCDVSPHQRGLGPQASCALQEGAQRLCGVQRRNSRDVLGTKANGEKNPPPWARETTCLADQPLQVLDSKPNALLVEHLDDDAQCGCHFL